MKLKRTKEIDRLLETSQNLVQTSDIGQEWIDHSAAIRLGKTCDVPLSILLKGTEVYCDPAPPDPPKSESYLKLMAQLKLQEENRQYQELIGEISVSNSDISPKSISKEVNDQLTVILNVLVSIFAVGWAFWYWCANWSLASRTFMGLFGALFTGLAEVVVFSGYMRRTTEAKKKKKKVPPESKRVVKEFVFHKGKETVHETELKRDLNIDECRHHTTEITEKDRR